MILRALIAPMSIKDDVADDLDEIIAELMSRRPVSYTHLQIS